MFQHLHFYIWNWIWHESYHKFSPDECVVILLFESPWNLYIACIICWWKVVCNSCDIPFFFLLYSCLFICKVHETLISVIWWTCWWYGILIPFVFQLNIPNGPYVILNFVLNFLKSNLSVFKILNLALP